ncbi:glycosyltransferase [Mangrovimonas sp. DI 80]|uniref:glycosyltransferase n=1 Tax=Mangrovimonas sp. DI 80 TaxID=1779330 RepID=UPI000977091E|nr:glycosyltransferase [Mangrovimonas sp. DI 80]OMP31170.1 hypothetical protein BKM32_08905 [Mangrovimonas sp. DI 80]
MKKRIKILFTIPNFDTAGSGKVVCDLVKGLNREVFEPHIACSHNRGAFFREVETLGVPIHMVDFCTPYRPFRTLPFRILKIARFFKREQFDLIHSWHWSSDFTETLAAKWAGIPYVYTKKAMGWGNKAWHWRSQLSTKIIAINRDMVTGILAPYSDKVQYMPLGVDLQRFQPLARTRTTPLGHSFQDSDFVIVSVANLAPVKGIELLLGAVQSLRNPGLKVLIVGDNQNAYGRELKQTYASPNIIFVKKQLDVRPYLSVADLFVIPTKDEGRKEGLPLAPLEAMASGRVVIGADIPGIRDLLYNYDNLLFRAGDTRHLAEKIQMFLESDIEARSSLGTQMCRRAQSQFSLTECIQAHQKCYQQIWKTYAV